MNIEKIRSEAPDGATHWDDGYNQIRYFRVKGRLVEVWFKGCWYGTFKIMIDIVKPLF